MLTRTHTIQTDKKRRRPALRGCAALILLSLLLVLVIALGIISVIFTNELLVPNFQVAFTLEVTNVSAHSITLPRTHETELHGTFGISWPGNQAAIVGDIISENQQTVTRQLQQTTAPLKDHTLVSFNTNVYLYGLRATLGLPIQTVQVADPLGPMPAWYVPGKLDTWAIIVHGHDDTLDGGLRFFPPLAKSGLPILDISYRNDVHAPASPDGLFHLGASEWQDVEAAAKYAFAHGAQHLVLYGMSMGGTIVEEFMHHSSYASRVQALILDSPVLDWRSTLNLQAANRNLPTILTIPVELVATLRTGINFDDLDQLDQPQGKTPILLFQGTGDTTTPAAVSDAFAKAHPDIVTYDRVSDAEHVQSWNTNPQHYDMQVSTFLSKTLHVAVIP